ncbi:hypothetical protein FJTKL_08809 [Diaporthe vaccinii]|uniref:Uncharacterized protein n=1 Tax=Diaporthe vaccinii TaxID=105482 RepID=A0ABR4EQL3_9PEZI
MSTNTRPELKFFLYSDPAEAKTPDNKRLVRVHVARNSHAKTRNARTRTPNRHQAHGEEDYLQAHSNELDAQVVSRTPSPSIPSGSQSSPYPPEVSELDLSLPSPSFQLPSGGPAQGLLQGLSPDERFLLDHYVRVQIPQWRNKYEYPHHHMDLARFRHGMLTQWVGFCLTDPGLLQGILLASSQYFVNLHYSSGNKEEGNRFQQRALYHRGQLLRSMSDSMSQDTRDLTDNIVAKGIFLAFNEYLAGNLTDSMRHMTACEYMIEMKGGFETLGLDGFLAELITWFREELYAAMKDKSFGRVRP